MIITWCKVDEDEPLFLSLISDLFPGIQLDVATYAELQKAISARVVKAQLINHPPWNLKVIQVCVAYVTGVHNFTHGKSDHQRKRFSDILVMKIFLVLVLHVLQFRTSQLV